MSSSSSDASAAASDAPAARQLGSRSGSELFSHGHRPSSAPSVVRRYSHSMVEGGLLEMSSATRFTPGTSLMMRWEICSSRS